MTTPNTSDFKAPVHSMHRMLTPSKVLITLFDVEEDLMGDPRAFGSLHRLGTEEGRDGHHDEREGDTTEHFGFGMRVVVETPAGH